MDGIECGFNGLDLCHNLYPRVLLTDKLSCEEP